MIRPFQVEENLQSLLDQHPTPDKFEKALKSNYRESREDMIRLWLTEGIPFAFRKCPALYEEMRSWLGKRLGICPKEITIIGSARIGFSLAGKEFGRPFNMNSDFDLSVISAPLFTSLSEAYYSWKRDYQQGIVHPRNERERGFWDENARIGGRNIQGGFLDANKIPTFDRYKAAQQIQDSISMLIKKLAVTPNILPPRSSSIRVYNKWYSLISRVSLNLNRAILVRSGLRT